MKIRDEIFLFLTDVMAHAIGPHTLYQAVTGLPMSYYYSTANYFQQAGSKVKKARTFVGTTQVDQSVQKFLHLSKVKWSGNWHMVVFDVPEKQGILRTRFRRYLEGLGFGMYQESLFIHPHDRFQEVKQSPDWNDLEECIGYFKLQTAGFPDQTCLIEKCWNLSLLKTRYYDFIDIFEKRISNFELLSKHQTPQTVKHIARWMIRVLDLSLYDILKIDPILPAVLLSEDWPAGKAIIAFQKWKHYLHSFLRLTNTTTL